MYAHIFANLGKITGKEIELTAESTANFKRDSSVLAANKVTLRCEGSTKFESAAMLAKQVEIQSDKFEADASSLYAKDNFHVNGRTIGLFNHTELSSGKSVTIHANRFRCENSKIESDLITFSISGCLDSFINLHSEIFAFKKLIIASCGDVHNLDSKM